MTGSRSDWTERPGRILHLLPWLGSGGVERRRLELARRLDKDRFEQHVVCISGRDHLVSAFEAEGVRVHQVGGGFLGPGNLLKSAGVAARLQPDIVHGAVSEGIIMAAAARPVCLGAKLVLEEPGYPANRSWRGHLVLRALSIGADRCVAVSPAIEDYFIRLGIPQRKTRLVMNGAPEPELPPTSERDARRAALGIAPGDFVVGSVGRMLDSHKRFSDLIRAIQLLRASDRTFRLLLVGDGPDCQALESLAGEIGAPDRDSVTFVGYRSDVGPMYALMDAFALVSEAESFGLVLVEAMYCGLAVVGTRTSGIENVVADGTTGILVPVGSVPEIARALQELRKDPARRAKLGAAGRERAVARFSTARYVADVEQLYEELLGRGTPASLRVHGVGP